MKKLTALFIFLSPLFAIAQITVQVSGKSSDPDKRAPLYFYGAGPGRPLVIDSVEIATDGTYQKQLRLKGPGVCLIGFSETETSPFWADQHPVQISYTSAALPSIKGDKNSELMEVFNQVTDQYRKTMSSQDPDSDRRKAGGDYRSRLISLIQTYHDVPAVIYLMHQFDFNSDRSFLSQAAAKLLNANPEHEAVKNYVFDISRLDAGHPATEVTFLNTSGEVQFLKEFLGKSKFTLVDFWGTYCVPCREGIPGIKKLYAQYRSKGLEILTISLDTKDDMWKKSLSEEQMPWWQGRTQDGGQKVMTDYRFNGIPYLALFDQNGAIVSLNLQHDALESKLKELMGEPDPVQQTQNHASAAELAEEAKIAQRILTEATLGSYEAALSKYNANNFKDTHMAELQKVLKMKAYQVSKIGWSLPTFFNEFQKVLNTKNLSVSEKVKALRSIDNRQMSLKKMVLEPVQYQEYLKLRWSKQLSL